MVLDNRYSQHARRAMNQARLLAQEYGHNAVDTDHLFAGILRESGSLGALILAELTVDVQQTEREVRELHQTGGSSNSPTLTDALTRVVILANDESRWFGHHYVGTEHLLLALARSREGGVPDLLRRLAITPDQIRRRVRLMLHEGVTELSVEAAKRMARLSELSRRVLNAAQQLAADEHHVSLEHLLLVLARERRSMASRLLQTYGLDVAGLERNLNQASAGTMLEDVIEHAVDRADQLGSHYTGTDHLLLALAQHPYGALLLARCGIDAGELITALYELLKVG